MAWVYRKKFKEKFPDDNINLFKKNLRKKINYHKIQKNQILHNDDIIKIAEQMIIDTINDDKIFYIGVSRCPMRRLFQHTVDKGGSPTMNVVKYYVDKANVRIIEKYLIKTYGSHINNYNNLLKNKPQKGGGEGLSNRKSLIYILIFNKIDIFNDILSENNKILSENNKILSEDNKILSEDIDCQ